MNRIDLFKAEARQLRSTAVIKMISPKSDIRQQYIADMNCPYCYGKGYVRYKLEDKECPKCKGTGKVPDNKPRMQFNRGYHDGAEDVKKDKERSFDDSARRKNPWYYIGYEYGAHDAKFGHYSGISGDAWKDFAKYVGITTVKG